MGKGNDGISFPTFANAPMDLEGKKPAPSTPIYSEEAHGSSTPSPGAPPSRDTSSSRLALGEALPGSRYFHHHAVVLPDLHQLLLPPCWIKKEETSPLRTCVECGGAVRSVLGLLGS